MESATIAEFLALNDQLIALVQAGVPIQLGLGGRGANAPAALERIAAAVARRVGQGASLSEALGDSRIAPPLYRNVVQLALQGGDLQAALGGAEQAGEAVDDSLHAIRFSLLYPLLLASLAYAGFVLFCLFFVPTLDNTYRSMRLQPGWELQLLQTLRATLPLWVALPPLVLFIVWLWLRFRARSAAASRPSARLLAWLPGMRQALFEQRCANFADSLASFLDSGAPLSEGLRLSAGAWDDEALEAATQDLAASSGPATAWAEHSALAKRLPPFLRWALCHGEESIGRPPALRMAADIYRQSAQRRADRLRITAPLITCVVLGGGVTLLYGLTLFVPVVQMLKGLAS